MAKKRENPYKTRGGFQDLLKEQIQDPEFWLIYQEERARTDLAMMVRSLRQARGLTQMELASRADTTQPVIARLESGRGRRMPSLPLLERIAAAAGSRLSLSFVPEAAVEGEVGDISLKPRQGMSFFDALERPPRSSSREILLDTPGDTAPPPTRRAPKD